MLAFGVLLSFWGRYIAYVLIQAYGEMFAASSRALPYATTLLLRWYPVLLCLSPLLVFAVWLIRRGRPLRGFAALLAGGAMFFIVPQLALTIMSLPVLDLGK